MRFTLIASLLGVVPIVHGSAPIGDLGIISLEELPQVKYMAVGGSDANHARAALDTLIGKRQTCSPGYGYCSNFGKCCPIDNTCCPYGFCLGPGQACCPNGVCDVGHTCCGSGCRPVDAECCLDGGYCDAGNHCYLINGVPGCCTDNKCTAYVTGGTTVTITTAQPTPTEVATQYYYFIITWTYYVYYWYYIIEIKASVVTSSLTTTSSSYSIKATDSAAASSSFDLISATISHYTPPAATSLKSLAGSTSFDSTTDEGPTSGPESTTTPFNSEPGSGGGSTEGPESTPTANSAATTSLRTTATLPNGGGGSNPTLGNGTNGASIATSARSSLLIWFGVISGAAAMFMVAL